MYCSGFYKEANRCKRKGKFEDYGFLEKIDIGGELFDLNQFLHGYCDEFAYYNALNYHYDIVVWYEWCEETEQFSLIHAFNRFLYRGKEYYVDVRGVTTDLTLIQEEFEDFEYTYVEVFHEIETFVQFMEKTYQEYYRPLKIGEIQSIHETLGSYYRLKENFLINSRQTHQKNHLKMATV